MAPEYVSLILMRRHVTELGGIRRFSRRRARRSRDRYGRASATVAQA
jgi:hypothetical protein